MALSDMLFYVIWAGMAILGAITLWAVLTPGQALYVG